MNSPRYKSAPYHLCDFAPTLTGSSQSLPTRFPTKERINFLPKSWYFCDQHAIFTARPSQGSINIQIPSRVKKARQMHK